MVVQRACEFAQVSLKLLHVLRPRQVATDGASGLYAGLDEVRKLGVALVLQKGVDEGQDDLQERVRSERGAGQVERHLPERSGSPVMLKHTNKNISTERVGFYVRESWMFIAVFAFVSFEGTVFPCTWHITYFSRKGVLWPILRDMWFLLKGGLLHLMKHVLLFHQLGKYICQKLKGQDILLTWYKCVVSKQHKSMYAYMDAHACMFVCLNKHQTHEIKLEKKILHKRYSS